MSADRWSRCPNCFLIWQKDQEAREQQAKYDADEAYGKVPVEEFEELRRALHEIEVEMFDSENVTFRQDYDFYFEEEPGEDQRCRFYAGFKGRCGQCGFEHEFKHEVRVEIPGVNCAEAVKR